MKSCPICTSTDLRIIRTRFKNIISTQPNLVICLRCDHWCVTPMPSSDNLHDFYSNMLKMDTKEYLYKYKSKKLPIFKRLLESHVRLPAAPTVLEVGPGPIGITPLVPASTHYVAIEPGSKNNQLLRASAQVNYLSLTCLEDVSELDACEIAADLIFSNAALEHMLSPKETLSRLKQHANPDCWFVIGVPARQVEFPDEALVRSGLYDNIDYCSTHLHSFSHTSMKALFDACGIEIVFQAPTLLAARMAGYDYIYNYWYDFAASRRNAQSIRWQLGYLMRLFYHRIIASRVIDPTSKGDDRGEILYVGRFKR